MPETLVFNPSGIVKRTRAQNAHLQRVSESESLTEGQFNSLRSAMNHLDDSFAKEVVRRLEERSEDIRVTDEQTQKGLAWLRDHHKSPTGKIRKHNPFTIAQVEILDNPSHFVLDSFENRGNGYRNNFVFVWRLYGTNGNSFCYVARYWIRDEKNEILFR